MFFYEICGLSVDSTFSIPLLKERDSSVKGNINISNSTLRSDVKFGNSRTIYQDDLVFYKSKTGSIYKISKNGIVVDQNQKEKDSQLGIGILGLPLGYLLRMNSLNVIHGCSISKNNKAACIVGKSGVGKSSIALGLTDAGFDFITEDLCVIKDQEIFSFSPWVKTTKKDFAKNNPIAFDRIKIPNDNRGRSFFKIPNINLNFSKSLTKIIYFPVQSKTRSIKRIEKIESFERIFSYSYRMENDKKTEFENITKLVKNVECYVYRRDIESSFEENLIFLQDHLEKKLG